MDVVTVEQLLKLQTNKDIKGKVICFPTDTVYGVGALIEDNEAINKIYNLKHRDKSKPLAVLTGNKHIEKYVLEISNEAKNLMDKYWPGALTIIFKKSNIISNKVTCNLDTIGLRMTNSKIALSILNHFGLMATTSVNISGSAPLNDIEEIKKHFSNEIDYLVIDKEETSNVSSTIIDASSSNLKVLRQGDIIIK